MAEVILDDVGTTPSDRARAGSDFQLGLGLADIVARRRPSSGR